MGKLKKSEKKGILFILSLMGSVFGTNLISAYTGSFGYFGDFATEDVFLLVMFVVIFFIINLAFSRFFRDSSGRPMKSAWIPALALSFGATYGIWTTGFNLGSLLIDVGISSDILNVLAPILLLGFLVFLIVKWGFTNILFTLGGIFVFVGIIDVVYRNWISIIIGIVLIGIGIFIKRKSKTKGRRKDFRDFKRREKFKKNLERKRGGGGSEMPNSKEDIKMLKRLAKEFKKWAKSTKKPRFYGSWANFINYLKKGNYGNSEKEIASSFGISIKRFVRIFNKYGKP